MQLTINNRPLNVYDMIKARESVLIKHEGDCFTPPMLRELARQFGLRTETEGWQLWMIVDRILDRLTAEHEIRAEIGYFYKINPYQLDDLQVFALRQHLPRLQSQEKIQRGQFDPLDYDSVYRLFLTAFGDEELARKKQSESFALFVEKQTKN